MSALQIMLLPVEAIRPTEQTLAQQVNSLHNEIRISGVWTHPILVDDAGYGIMDGHHRYGAALRLGLRTVPAVLLRYEDARVRLDTWRPGEAFTPERLRDIARSGELLPPKSTRHVIEGPLPRCNVPVATLRTTNAGHARIEAAARQPTRAQLLTPHYHALGRRIGIATTSADAVDTESAATLVPHPRLRQLLQLDAAMAALLPATAARIALGDATDAPFFRRASGLLMLPPSLLHAPAALAIAARWGLECAGTAAADARRLTAVLRHAAALLAAAPEPARGVLLDMLPAPVARELCLDRGRQPSVDLLAWQAGRIEGIAVPDRPATAPPALQLEAPLEAVLTAGGDSRLGLDPATGFNRYGVPPRPRPEAVHFSSSTASAISDYGFMFADILRRDLLAAVLQDGGDPTDLRRRAVQAVADELSALLGLEDGVADMALAASGTDLELLAVLLALAGAGTRPLINLLIAPVETGRGVRFAGEGRYFDDIAATGAPIEKGAAVWPGAAIAVREIALREADGTPRAGHALDAEFVEAGRRALDAGAHVLAHVLTTSKTGLSAPSPAAVAALVALAPDRVDVVVDACQMRSDFHDIGSHVERGWMVQISGSKFLTGPPFSGALVVPTGLRARHVRMAALLAAAPGVGRAEDWNAWWAGRLPVAPDLGPPSFGPVFRWLPALFEAHLLSQLPQALRRWAFERFRAAITGRLSASQWLRPLDVEAPAAGAPTDADLLSRLSIVSFEVLGQDRGAAPEPLGEDACRRMFDLLNLDVSDRLGSLSASERELAAQQAHIGQPVTLASARGPITVLRMVLGARFFTIVGHAGPGSIEAALESEISDALRALGKLELLAARWWRLDPREQGGP